MLGDHEKLGGGVVLYQAFDLERVGRPPVSRRDIHGAGVSGRQTTSLLVAASNIFFLDS
jgi:hypothetical protein